MEVMEVSGAEPEAENDEEGDPEGKRKVDR